MIAEPKSAPAGVVQARALGASRGYCVPGTLVGPPFGVLPSMKLFPAEMIWLVPCANTPVETLVIKLELIIRATVTLSPFVTSP